MSHEILNIPAQSNQLKSILHEGSLEQQGQRWIALPREVVFQNNKMETVIFETILPQDLKKPLWPQVFFEALRLDSLLRVLLPTFAIVLYGLSRNWFLHQNLGLLACGGAACLQMSAHLLNDIRDYLELKDLPDTLSGRGVLQKGWLSPKQLKSMAYFFLVLGIALGIPAVLKAPLSLFLLGLLAGLGVFLYSWVSNSFFQTILFFLLQGPFLALGISISFFNQWDLGLIFLGSFFGFFACSVLHAQHIEELAFSKANMKQNSLAARLGFQGARHFLVLIYSLALACVLIPSAFSIWPVWVALCLLVSVTRLVVWLMQIYRASGPLSPYLSFLKKDAFHFYCRFGIWITVAWFLSAFNMLSLFM